MTQLLAQTTSRELTEWQIYFRLESERREQEKMSKKLEDWIDGG